MQGYSFVLDGLKHNCYQKG